MRSFEGEAESHLQIVRNKKTVFSQDVYTNVWE